ILASAAAALRPEKTDWLAVKIWQKQTDEEMRFEAEGRLVRGPHHCARLEMTIQTGQGCTEVLVVSDGVGLADACRPANQPTDVNTQRFTTPSKTRMTAEQIELRLSGHAHAGPNC